MCITWLIIIGYIPIFNTSDKSDDKINIQFSKFTLKLFLELTKKNLITYVPTLVSR